MGAGRLAEAGKHLSTRPTPRTLWLIVVAGCAAAAGTMALALTSDHGTDQGLQASLSDWIILSYIFSGAAAWWRRPDSRFGPLMVAAGFVIALTTVRAANAGVPYTIGWTLRGRSVRRAARSARGGRRKTYRPGHPDCSAGRRPRGR